MRSVMNYIQGFLNYGASTSPTGAFEAVTGLRIATGSFSGSFLELPATNQEVGSINPQNASSGAIVGVNILTAGSGQTNGTYSATASFGGAQISYTIAGGALTAVTITNPGTGSYLTESTPTFTIAAGGTPGTVQAVIGLLYSGVYQKVKLSSTSSAVVPGQVVFWNESDTTDPYAVTGTYSAGVDNYIAGWVIDPGMNTTTGPYAWIQVNGKVRALFTTVSSGAIGDAVFLTASSNTLSDPAQGSAPTNASFASHAGIALTAPVALATSLVAVTRPQVKW
jgi:hypothetical protein